MKKAGERWRGEKNKRHGGQENMRYSITRVSYSSCVSYVLLASPSLSPSLCCRTSLQCGNLISCHSPCIFLNCLSPPPPLYCGSSSAFITTQSLFTSLLFRSPLFFLFTTICAITIAYCLHYKENMCCCLTGF